jgi:uncharacterized membrane protein YfcA
MGMIKSVMIRACRPVEGQEDQTPGIEGRHSGDEDPERERKRRRNWWILAALVAILIGALIGFYDGFFGPGTGSFFVFLLVRLLGYDFLHASASAKLLNTASNLAALSLFAMTGHVWWHLVLAMAVANMVGSMAGTHLALKHGTGFVRIGFLVVVSALIVKTGWDAFLR